MGTCDRRTDAECRDKLRQGDQQEVEVVEKLELLVQDEGEEGDEVVLLVLDDVGRMGRLFPLRRRLVQHDRAWF